MCFYVTYEADYFLFNKEIRKSYGAYYDSVLGMEQWEKTSCDDLPIKCEPRP